MSQQSKKRKLSSEGVQEDLPEPGRAFSEEVIAKMSETLGPQERIQLVEEASRGMWELLGLRELYDELHNPSNGEPDDLGGEEEEDAQILSDDEEEDAEILSEEGDDGNDGSEDFRIPGRQATPHIPLLTDRFSFLFTILTQKKAAADRGSQPRPEIPILTLADLQLSARAYVGGSDTLPCLAEEKCVFNQLCCDESHPSFEEETQPSCAIGLMLPPEWITGPKERRYCLFCQLLMVHFALAKIGAQDFFEGMTLNSFRVPVRIPGEFSDEDVLISPYLSGAFPRYPAGKLAPALLVMKEPAPFFPGHPEKSLNGTELVEIIDLGQKDKTAEIRKGYEGSSGYQLVPGFRLLWQNFQGWGKLPRVSKLQYTSYPLPVMGRRPLKSLSQGNLLSELGGLRSRLEAGSSNLGCLLPLLNPFNEALSWVREHGFPSNLINNSVVLNCVILCPLLVAENELTNTGKLAYLLRQKVFASSSNKGLTGHVEKGVIYAGHPLPYSDKVVCQEFSIYWTVLGIANVCLHLIFRLASQGSSLRDHLLLHIERVSPLLRLMAGLKARNITLSDSNLLPILRSEGCKLLPQFQAIFSEFDAEEIISTGFVLWTHPLTAPVSTETEGDTGITDEKTLGRIINRLKDPGLLDLLLSYFKRAKPNDARMTRNLLSLITLLAPEEERKNSWKDNRIPWLQNLFKVHVLLQANSQHSEPRYIYGYYEEDLLDFSAQLAQRLDFPGIFDPEKRLRDALDSVDDIQIGSDEADGDDPESEGTAKSEHPGASFARRELDLIREMSWWFSWLIPALGNGQAINWIASYRYHPNPARLRFMTRCLLTLLSRGFKVQEKDASLGGLIPSRLLSLYAKFDAMNHDELINHLADHSHLTILAQVCYLHSLMQRHPYLCMEMDRQSQGGFGGWIQALPEMLRVVEVDLSAGMAESEAELMFLVGKIGKTASPERTSFSLATHLPPLLDKLSLLPAFRVKGGQLSSLASAKGHYLRFALKHLVEFHTLVIDRMASMETSTGKNAPRIIKPEESILLLLGTLAQINLTRSVLDKISKIFHVIYGLESSKNLENSYLRALSDSPDLTKYQALLVRLFLEHLSLGAGSVRVVVHALPGLAEEQLGNYLGRGSQLWHKQHLAQKEKSARCHTLLISPTIGHIHNIRCYALGSPAVSLDVNLGIMQADCLSYPGKPSSHRLIKAFDHWVETVSLPGKVVIFPRQPFTFTRPSQKENKSQKIRDMYFTRWNQGILAHATREKNTLGVLANLSFETFLCQGRPLTQEELSINILTLPRLSAYQDQPLNRPEPVVVESLTLCSECGALMPFTRDCIGAWPGFWCGRCPQTRGRCKAVPHCALCGSYVENYSYKEAPREHLAEHVYHSGVIRRRRGVKTRDNQARGARAAAIRGNTLILPDAVMECLFEFVFCLRCAETKKSDMIVKEGDTLTAGRFREMIAQLKGAKVPA